MRVLALGLVAVLLVACEPPGDGQTAGTEGGPCYANGTCNAGLDCVSGTCAVKTSPRDVANGNDLGATDARGSAEVAESELGEDIKAGDIHVPVRDAPPPDPGVGDTGCTPRCEGRECGDDGCGGYCGECGGATPYCEGATCLPACTAESAAVDGWVRNSVNDMDFSGESAPILAQHRDGRVVEYPSPNATPQVAKLWDCVAATADPTALPCGLEAARPHVACVEALEEAGIDPHIFPDEIVRVSETEGGRLRWVEGLAATLEASYATGEWPGLPGQA